MSDSFLGERLPKGRTRRQMSYAGWGLALLGLVWTLVLTPMYIARGTENGPNWLAANYLVLELGIFMLGAGGALVGVAAWNRNYLLMGLLSGAVLVAVASELPESLRDAFGALEPRSVDVVESVVDHNGKAGARISTGETYWWVEGFGVVRYPPIAPGRYDLILTSERHRIVGATPAK